MIVLEEVDKSFQGKAVLRGVSLHLNKGDAVGLLGSSGSGKSTVLSLIAGLQKPDNGRLKVCTKRLGFVFQDHRLLPWRTALENVIFALKAIPESWSEEEMRARAIRALTSVGLTEFLDYYPGKLSGGMCQRVSIARAFAMEPDILLLDEPFSALDLELKNSLLSDLKKMLHSCPKMAVVYVTHNSEELTGIVNSACTLVGGRVIHRVDMDTVLGKKMKSRVQHLVSDADVIKEKRDVRRKYEKYTHKVGWAAVT